MALLAPWVWGLGSATFLVILITGGVHGASTGTFLAVDTAGWIGFLILAIGGQRLPDWYFELSQYMAAATVTALFLLTDDPSTPFGLFYLWLIVHSAYFGRWRRALAQGVTVSIAYGVAIAIVSDGSFPAVRVGMLVLTLFFVGTMIALLRARLDAVVERLHLLAETDELTGLHNRRRLEQDLERLVPSATAEREVGITVFDLDGFKQYNDTFGHPAGDALLIRLAARLKEAVRGEGWAYRLGGDEFCVLVVGDEATRGTIVDRAVTALTEWGEGFLIDSSYGSAVVPTEVETAEEALELADRRLYRDKVVDEPARTRRLRLFSQSGEDGTDEPRIAARLGARFGLSGGELDVLTRAAALHDIGKIAIPVDLLGEPRPLEEDELDFVRRYVLIGERLLHADQALGAVADVVRASRERWDGTGYPDGLVGEAIPLPARIIAVCSAFESMTTASRRREAMFADAAIEELRRHTGTQFDPTVVSALAELVEAERQELTHGRTGSTSTP